MSERSYIFDVTGENFRELVLGNSRKGPVLVHYWSPKAGPSLKLWPILEKLATEFSGKFLLVNLNTDKLGDLAREYGINSIPTVKVFLHEKAVETVHGANSEASFHSLINKYVARQSDTTLLAAVMRFEQGHTDESLKLLEQAAEADPDNPRIPIAHAKLLIKDGAYAKAEEILRALPRSVRESDEMINLLVHVGFLQAGENASDAETLLHLIEEQPGNMDARYQLCAVALSHDDYEQALEQLFEILKHDSSYKDNIGAKGMIMLFNMLGTEHPLTKKYRSMMQVQIN